MCELRMSVRERGDIQKNKKDLRRQDIIILTGWRLLEDLLGVDITEYKFMGHGDIPGLVALEQLTDAVTSIQSGRIDCGAAIKPPTARKNMYSRRLGSSG